MISMYDVYDVLIDGDSVQVGRLQVSMDRLMSIILYSVVRGVPYHTGRNLIPVLESALVLVCDGGSGVRAVT